MNNGRIIFFIISVAIFSLSCFSYSEYHGLKFKYLGPNCFGAALKISGHYPYFRGVDAPEFSHYIQNYCSKVANPSQGDIGVYNAPNSDFLVHAFVYIDNKYIIEKSGVDYLGATPIKLQTFEITQYVFGSSPECKRYSNNDPICHNELNYYKCEKPDLKLSADLKLEMNTFEQLIEKKLLNTLSQHESQSLTKRYESIKMKLESQILDQKTSSYLMSKLVSYEKQLIFLKLRT